MFFQNFNFVNRNPFFYDIEYNLTLFTPQRILNSRLISEFSTQFYMNDKLFSKFVKQQLVYRLMASRKIVDNSNKLLSKSSSLLSNFMETGSSPYGFIVNINSALKTLKLISFRNFKFLNFIYGFDHLFVQLFHFISFDFEHLPLKNFLKSFLLFNMHKKTSLRLMKIPIPVSIKHINFHFSQIFFLMRFFYSIIVSTFKKMYVYAFSQNNFRKEVSFSIFLNSFLVRLSFTLNLWKYKFNVHLNLNKFYLLCFKFCIVLHSLYTKKWSLYTNTTPFHNWKFIFNKFNTSFYIVKQKYTSLKAFQNIYFYFINFINSNPSWLHIVKPIHAIFNFEVLHQELNLFDSVSRLANLTKEQLLREKLHYCGFFMKFLFHFRQLVANSDSISSEYLKHLHSISNQSNFVFKHILTSFLNDFFVENVYSKMKPFIHAKALTRIPRKLFVVNSKQFHLFYILKDKVSNINMRHGLKETTRKMYKKAFVLLKTRIATVLSSTAFFSAIYTLRPHAIPVSYHQAGSIVQIFEPSRIHKRLFFATRLLFQCTRKRVIKLISEGYRKEVKFAYALMREVYDVALNRRDSYSFKAINEFNAFISSIRVLFHRKNTDSKVPYDKTKNTFLFQFRNSFSNTLNKNQSLIKKNFKITKNTSTLQNLNSSIDVRSFSKKKNWLKYGQNNVNLKQVNVFGKKGNKFKTGNKKS